MNKIYLILIAVVSIVIVMITLPVLSNQATELTTGEPTYIPLENSVLSHVDSAGNYRSYVSITEEDLLAMINEEKTIYFIVPDFTDSTVSLSPTIESYQFRILWGEIRWIIDFDNLNTHFTNKGYTLEGDYTVFNESLIREGFFINALELYNVFNAIQNNAYGTDIIDAVNFETDTLKFVVNYALYDPEGGDLEGDLYTDYFTETFLHEEDITEAQITGTTATLINILPMIIVTGILVTTIGLIYFKKRG